MIIGSLARNSQINKWPHQIDDTAIVLIGCLDIQLKITFQNLILEDYSVGNCKITVLLLLYK